MSPLAQRIAAGLEADVRPEVCAFAHALSEEAGALAVLFYGSNLRTGELEGVLDFYVLLPGAQAERIWPRVSYAERKIDGETLRAKIATMALDTFARAAAGRTWDTTIWARFVQPSALVWARDDDARGRVVEAVADAARTAARLAAALGPERGAAHDFWRALFRETYTAEFRIEKAGREDAILSVNARHFEGLLPLAWSEGGVAFSHDGATLVPNMDPAERRRILRAWQRLRRLGKPLNLLRLAKAATTFDGAARYAAWKVHRHTGVAIEVTPFREKHPLLAAPGALLEVWKLRRK